MRAAKELGKDPLVVAQETAAALAGLPGIEKAEPVRPGFVNLTLTTSLLMENLLAMLAAPDSYGADPDLKPERFLIEFVSANPTGPLHVASGRAAALGDSLARILRRIGHQVHTEYYVNDMGRQVELLGESLKARREGREVPEGGYRGDYIATTAQAMPVNVFERSPREIALYAIHTDYLIRHRSAMEAFGVTFDRWFAESELHTHLALKEVLKLLRELGKVYEAEGAFWLGSSSDGTDDKDRVLLKKDGSPTYFLSDIAYHKDKLDRGYTRLIDIWGADHHGYVPRMKAAVAALGHDGKLTAVIHQLVHLYRGTTPVKMSKRAGEFVTLSEVVEEVGRDACRFFFARLSPNQHLNFDLELAKKQSQENPVYYVQYGHARICSIFREAEKQGFPPLPAPPGGGEGRADLGLLKTPEERDLILHLAWFPEILKACQKELSPHPLTVYLAEAAGLFHPFYEKHRVVGGSERELTEARLALCEGVRWVLREGLGLLGVSTPEKM